jgi:hypothetical protein
LKRFIGVDNYIIRTYDLIQRYHIFSGNTTLLIARIANKKTFASERGLMGGKRKALICLKG